MNMSQGIFSFYKNGLYSLLVGLCLLFSCSGEAENEEKKKETPLTEEERLWQKALAENKEPDVPLDKQLTNLQSSITRYETMAFESEEAKLNGSLLLIEEVTQSLKDYSRSELESIQKLYNNAKDALYTKETMADPDVMDTYDAKILTLIEAWKAFKENTPEFEKHARAKIIYDDIMKADSQDLVIRSRYNLNVSDFNKILTDKKEEVKELGYNFKIMKPYPFFWGEDPQIHSEDETES